MAKVGSYDSSKVKTEALHAVRFHTGDTKAEKFLLADGEIDAMLDRYGLTLTSTPKDNEAAITKTVVDCLRAIVNDLAGESEIEMTDIGPIKSEAATQFRRSLEDWERKLSGFARPFFADPRPYPVTHVAGVDPVPELE